MAFLQLSPCSIQLQGEQNEENDLIFCPSHKLTPLPKSPISSSFAAALFPLFYLQTHDMFVLFPRFLCSGEAFPASDPPWLSAAFLHGAILQQPARGGGREALQRLGTDSQQARLGAFGVLKTRNRRSLTERSCPEIVLHPW